MTKLTKCDRCGTVDDLHPYTFRLEFDHDPTPTTKEDTRRMAGDLCGLCRSQFNEWLATGVAR